jgi:hypothetical protein
VNKNYFPKWKLEWYLRGALPAEEREAIAALEESDGELRGRIDAIRANDAELRAKYPPEEMARKAVAAFADNQRNVKKTVSVHAFWERWGRGGASRWTIPAFACAALCLLIIPIRMFLTDDGQAQFAYMDTGVYEDRVKGAEDIDMSSPSLEVWRKAGDAVEQLAPGTHVQAGDVVQLRYIVPEPYYGAVVSVDGIGVMTVHLSDNWGKAVQLTPGRPVALKTSYKLDDAPKYEVFYLITAADNFVLDSVTRILEDAEHPLADTLLPQERQVTVFTLIKPNDRVTN